jgi:hypothetical protein
MNTNRLVPIFVGALTIQSSTVIADSGAERTSTTGAIISKGGVAYTDISASTATKEPTYKPPRVGAPKGVRLVGGGTRSRSGKFVTLVALVPDHTGLTTKPQPSLYWYLSEVAKTPMVLTVIEETAVKPIIELQLVAPKSPGIQKVRLSDYGISLKPGVEYEWTIAVVPDSVQRSHDIITGGTIQRIAPTAKLIRELDGASHDDYPYVYAKHGLWYDAMASISELIDANPSNSKLRAQRAALLEQVGLSGMAVTDGSMRSSR